MKTKSILLIFALFVMIFSSCGKYEEGPDFSLESKKARLTADWILEAEYENGEAQEISNYEEYYYYRFEKSGFGNFICEEHEVSSGAFSVTIESSSLDLQWEFDEEKGNFRYRYKSGTSWHDWSEWRKIIRLKEKELWVKYTEEKDGADVEKEEHYIKKKK